jgi:hypothetical protein
MLLVCFLPYPPSPPGNSANQQLAIFEHWFEQSMSRSFDIFSRSLCSVVASVGASGQGWCRFHSMQKQITAFEWEGMAGGPVHIYSFWMQGGDGWQGRYKRRQAGQAGRYKIFLMLGGGGGLEGTHWSLYTFITHKRLPPSQQFSASQNADSILLTLNNSCPWAHLHSLSNETGIPLNGISVQSNH